MSMMVSFVLSFFPRDVLDEILNLIESVSEDFPSYSYVGKDQAPPDLTDAIIILLNILMGCIRMRFCQNIGCGRLLN